MPRTSSPADTKPGSDSVDRPQGSALVLVALVLTAVVCNLNLAGANVALPAIGDQFGAPQTLLNLVGVGAGLGLSMAVLYAGALADRYGRKQLLMLGLALIAIMSVISAFAPTIEILIAARILTGISAGLAFPTTLSLITALWPAGPRRTGAIAIWSSVGGMASVIGGVLAGTLLIWFWWGSVFLLSIPVAAIALVIVWRTVPSHVDETTEPVDHLGGVLSVLGIAALVLGISFVFVAETQVLGLLLLGGAVVMLGLFFVRQRRAASPLFDLRVAKRRLFWGAALAGGIVFGGLIGGMFIGEQFMQNVLGYSPLEAGLAVIPAAVGLVLIAPFSARLIERSGVRVTMLTGYSVVFASFLTMLTWREDTAYPLIGLGFFLIGAGVSFVITAASKSLTSSTPVRRIGMASATSDLQSDLGGSILQALFGAVLATGFAQSFSDLIAGDGEVTVSASVQQALQSSYASAMHVAEQAPQYRDEILQAARESLTSGSMAAYGIGAAIILIGFVVVTFALPGRKQEEVLLAQYALDNEPGETDAEESAGPEAAAEVAPGAGVAAPVD